MPTDARSKTLLARIDKLARDIRRDVRKSRRDLGLGNRTSAWLRARRWEKMFEEAARAQREFAEGVEAQLRKVF